MISFFIGRRGIASWAKSNPNISRFFMRAHCTKPLIKINLDLYNMGNFVLWMDHASCRTKPLKCINSWNRPAASANGVRNPCTCICKSLVALFKIVALSMEVTSNQFKNERKMKCYPEFLIEWLLLDVKVCGLETLFMWDVCYGIDRELVWSMERRKKEEEYEVVLKLEEAL